MFLTIQTTDVSFVSRDEGNEYATLAYARKAAVAVASNIARIELMAGNDTPSVLAEVFDHEGILVTSVMVTLSAANTVAATVSTTG